MIPMLPVEHILGLLRCFVQIIQHLRRQRQIRSNALHDDFEIFIILKIIAKLLLQYLTLIQLILRYMSLRRKKFRLYKPHLLLQLLAGYR